MSTNTTTVGAQVPYWMSQQTADATNKNNNWTKMMQMMATIPKMSDEQMIGYALGRLIHDGWMNYKDSEDAKQKAKADGTSNVSTTTTPTGMTSNDTSTSYTQGSYLTPEIIQQGLKNAMPTAGTDASENSTIPNGVTQTDYTYNPSSGDVAMRQISSAVTPMPEIPIEELLKQYGLSGVNPEDMVIWN